MGRCNAPDHANSISQRCFLTRKAQQVLLPLFLVFFVEQLLVVAKGLFAAVALVQPPNLKTGLKPTAARVKDGKTYVLLIDGDAFGPASWGPAQEAIRARGTLRDSYVFAIPQAFKSRKWRQTMQSLGIQAFPVTKQIKGDKQHNHLAISMEAAHLVACGHVNSIGLLGKDRSFIYTASHLSYLGASCVALMSEGDSMRLQQAFEDAQADVVFMKRPKVSMSSTPSMKMVLHLNGDCTPTNMTAADVAAAQLHAPTEDLARELHRLDYVSSMDDPLLPAVAKFFLVNQIGPLTTYPSVLGICEANAVISATALGEWARNPGNLVFVLPRRSGSKKKQLQEEFGSEHGASIGSGGGAFILESGPSLVDDVLTRLGFLDDVYNTDFGEAVDTFCAQTRNFRELRLLGLPIPSVLDTSSKRALLHAAFVSSKHHGLWTQAPPDENARIYLESRGFLASRSAPVNLVYAALVEWATDVGWPVFRNYNLMVKSLADYLNRERQCGGRT